MTMYLFQAALLFLLPRASAIVPSAILNVRTSSGQAYSLLASQASFGPMPPMEISKSPPRVAIFPPDSNPLLCENITGVVASSSSSPRTIMLVPRGECTFQRKARNAQMLGAEAIVIYGTLASRYSVNKTNHEDEKYPEYSTKDIIWPQKYFDYDCEKGRAEVPAPDVRLKPLPYNADFDDPLLSGDTDDNLCRLYSPTQLRSCDSKMCLLTGQIVDGESKFEACCAWDLHVWLYSDPDSNETVSIPAAFLTAQEGLKLLKDVKAGPVEIALYSRYRPEYNISSILIWMLGVFVASFAAYLSAGDYHHKIRRVLRRARARAAEPEPNADGRDGKDSGGVASSHGALTERRISNQDRPISIQEESLELLPIHALAFLVMASSGLFILFFFKIYNFVKVMYAFGCSSAVVQVIFQPLVQRIAKHRGFRDFIVLRTNTVDFGDISYLDIIAFMLGYSLGFLWLYVAFSVPHPDENTFFWVMQDIMGTCMCIVFLGIIKLNSIRVAAILLTAAFFYDVFMVFVTPYIFSGKSVMITVATSGGPPKADPSWCEKYPNDRDCKGGDPLPMLLTVPRIGDYLGGSSLLGLGDIVCK